jgi:hypothetical protein
MNRAQGKHRQRKPTVPEIQPDSPEGRQLGMSDRMQGTPSPIPGGRPHISNAPTIRHKVPTPDSRPEITDQNAHGVPHGSATSRERAEVERGPNTIHQDRPRHGPGPADVPRPIPVYVVQDHNQRVYRSAAPRHFTLPAAGGEPVRLCGRDLSRTAVLILNESGSSDIRFGQRPADLNNGGGALLPWPSNSYVRLTTQDELYAISKDSGTPAISVIQEFEQTNG